MRGYLCQCCIYGSFHVFYLCARHNRDGPAMNEFDGAAYNMAAVTATVALYRALVRKGLMAREEARQRRAVCGRTTLL